MKRRDSLKELRSMSVADLKERARSVSEEIMKLRFRQVTGQLEQSHRLKILKRSLARTRTILAQQVGASAQS